METYEYLIRIVMFSDVNRGSKRGGFVPDRIKAEELKTEGRNDSALREFNIIYFDDESVAGVKLGTVRSQRCHCSGGLNCKIICFPRVRT